VRLREWPGAVRKPAEHAEEAGDRVWERAQRRAGRSRLAAELVDGSLGGGTVDLEAGQLDQTRDRRAPVVGALEVERQGGCVREHVDDPGLAAALIQIRRVERRPGLGRCDHLDKLPERGNPSVALARDDPESADEDDGLGHGGVLRSAATSVVSGHILIAESITGAGMSEAPTGPGEPGPASTQAEDDARSRLTSNQRAHRLRRLWRMLPGGPRCKICTSPFGPPVGPVLRLVGKGRWPGNPQYCGGCFKDLYAHREGAEVETTLFFADVRGSTALAETMTASAFRGLLDRFYAVTAEVLVQHEAVVDKFVGDEVIGFFVPALAGADHARRAIDAGIALLRATGNGSDAPWVPIGIGVNTGIAYVGAVGTAEHVEFTALGDAVNVTARLASAAGPGELLVTEAAARAAAFPTADLERRQLDLRGKTASIEVIVVTARPGSDHAARST